MSTTPDIYQLAEEVLKSKPPQTAPASEKEIVISADERRRLEQLLGKNLSSGKDLIFMVEKCVAISTDDVKIELHPYLLDRLKSRAIRVPFDEFMSKTVKRLLEEYVGLR